MNDNSSTFHDLAAFYRQQLDNLATLEKTSDKKVSDLLEFIDNVSELQAKIHSQAKENEQLQSDLNDATMKLASATKDTDSNIATITDLTNELAQAKNHISKLLDIIRAAIPGKLPNTASDEELLSQLLINVNRNKFDGNGLYAEFDFPHSAGSKHSLGFMGRYERISQSNKIDRNGNGNKNGNSEININLTPTNTGDNYECVVNVEDEDERCYNDLPIPVGHVDKNSPFVRYEGEGKSNTGDIFNNCNNNNNNLIEDNELRPRYGRSLSTNEPTLIRSEIMALESRIRALTKENEAVTQMLTNRIGELQSSLGRVRETLSTRAEKAESALAEAQKKIITLTKENIKLEKSEMELEVRVASLATRGALAQSDAQKAVDEVERISKRQLKALQIENERVVSKTQEAANAKIKEVYLEFRDYREKMEPLLQKEKDKNAAIVGRIKQLENRIRTQGDEITLLRATIRTLQDSLSSQ